MTDRFDHQGAAPDFPRSAQQVWTDVRDLDGGRRKPQAAIETFDLGHYEQQMLEVALLCATEPATYRADLLTRHEVETIKGLRPIFASHGTVTVTRTNQED